MTPLSLPFAPREKPENWRGREIKAKKKGGRGKSDDKGGGGERERMARVHVALSTLFGTGSRDRPVTFSFYSAVLFSFQFHSPFRPPEVRVRARPAAIKSTSGVSGIDNRSRECNGRTISRFNAANGRQVVVDDERRSHRF